jgi:hypothetical protein
MKKAAAGILAAILAGGVWASGQRLETSRDASGRRAFLEKELALAGTPGVYVVFDLAARTVSLKSRGVDLKTWTLARARVWGVKAGLRSAKLVRKSTLFPPKRKNITPKPGEEIPAQLDVLELDKMPARFSFDLGDRLKVKVRPKTKKFFKSILNSGGEVLWFGYLPLKTIWGAVGKKPFTEVEIVTTNEKDAKAIYWAFYEGQGCIIADLK